MYKKSEVEKVALDYFGDPLVANVWLDKYALKESDDEFLELSPDDTIKRITKELVRIEKNYPNPLSEEEIYDLLKGYKKGVFGGSILFGLGNNTLSTLGNCFVIDSPSDSYGGIFKSDQELAQLMKRRGGVGIDISTLRPKHSKVLNAANSSTGTVSFAERFSNTTREVAQGGRRGALMISMDVDHPDILDFILAKNDLTKVTGANISVKVTDAFMQGKDMHGKIVWDTLIYQAWKSAEPGIIFWDKVIKESPADCYKEFKTITTNPCSELPLCAYDSCRLASINLYEYVISPFTNNSGFDLRALYEDTMKFQRLMDDVVDLEGEKINKILDKINNDPEPFEIKRIEFDLWAKIKSKLILGRRTGLGQMGLADAGAALGLQYGEEAFTQLALEISRTIALASYTSSIILASERNSFPVWNKELESDNPFVKRVLAELPEETVKLYRSVGRRNIANLAIAPTGSISLLAQVSSGIEPVFSLSYNRRRKVNEDNPNKTYKDKNGDWWETYEVFHPKFKEFIEVKAKASALVNEMKNSDIEAWTKESPYYKACAHEINPKTKLKLQSICQQWVDHSISITYNLPKESTEKDVSELYYEAWKLGLKGLTVYRDGSREGILSSSVVSNFEQHDAPKRPNPLFGEAFHVKVRGELFTVVIGLFNEKPYEVFAYKGDGLKGKGNIEKKRSGSYIFKNELGEFQITDNLTDEQATITRLVSTSLRHGTDIKFIVEQLNKTKGDLTSFSKAISRTLGKFLKDVVLSGSTCPNCNSTLHYNGGCVICPNCGWSKCN